MKDVFKKGTWFNGFKIIFDCRKIYLQLAKSTDKIDLM